MRRTGELHGERMLRRKPDAAVGAPVFVDVPYEQTKGCQEIDNVLLNVTEKTHPMREDGTPSLQTKR